MDPPRSSYPTELLLNQSGMLASAVATRRNYTNLMNRLTDSMYPHFQRCGIPKAALMQIRMEWEKKLEASGVVRGVVKVVNAPPPPPPPPVYRLPSPDVVLKRQSDVLGSVRSVHHPNHQQLRLDAIKRMKTEQMSPSPFGGVRTPPSPMQSITHFNATHISGEQRRLIEQLMTGGFRHVNMGTIWRQAAAVASAAAVVAPTPPTPPQPLPSYMSTFRNSVKREPSEWAEMATPPSTELRQQRRKPAPAKRCLPQLDGDFVNVSSSEDDDDASSAHASSDDDDDDDESIPSTTETTTSTASTPINQVEDAFVDSSDATPATQDDSAAATIDDTFSEEENEEEEEDADDELNGTDMLNSDDDISDDGANCAAMNNANNILICQFEKIHRAKAKWKFVLKDGIMSLNDAEYVFSKAQGEAEW